MKRIIKLIVIIAWSGQIGGFQAEFPVVSLFKKEFVVWSINRIDNKNKHGTIFVNNEFNYGTHVRNLLETNVYNFEDLRYNRLQYNAQEIVRRHIEQNMW